MLRSWKSTAIPLPNFWSHRACNGKTLHFTFYRPFGFLELCSFCQRELCSMALRSYLALLSLSLYRSLIREKILITCTVGVGWVIHARRSCYPLNFTKALIMSHTVSNCHRYVVMTLTHSFAVAETSNKVQRRLNHLSVPSSPPTATLVATLSYYSIACFSELVDM